MAGGRRFAPLAEKLDALGPPGGESTRVLSQEIADVLLTDASDVPQRLGGEESSLYDRLKWATQVELTFKQGLEATVRDLQEHRRDIEALPDSGTPGQLRQDLREELALLAARLGQDDFHKHAADLNTTLTTLKTRTRDAAAQMADAQKATIKESQQDLQRQAEWPELTQEEQAQAFAQLDGLAVEAAPDLRGLKQLLSQEFVINSRLSDLRKHIEQLGRKRRLEQLEEEKARIKKAGQTKLSRTLQVPGTLTRADQLEALLQQLQKIKEELALYCDIEVTIRIED